MAVTFPAEAIKMRMQSTIGRATNFQTVAHSALKNEGLIGLYQGLTSTVLAVAPEKAIMFGVNGVLRNFAKKYQDERGMLPFPLEFGIGAMAGTGHFYLSQGVCSPIMRMNMSEFVCPRAPLLVCTCQWENDSRTIT